MSFKRHFIFNHLHTFSMNVKRNGGLCMKRVFLYTFWAISSVAAIVCLLCDFVISKDLDWSLIVGLSLGVSGVLIPVVIKGKHPLRNGLICSSLIILPFLYILSVLVQERLIFSLGGSIAVWSGLFLWGAYVVYVKLHMQIYRVLSISVLLTLPLIFGILYCCKYFLSDFALDSNSIMYHLSVTILLAFIFFSVDIAKSNRVRD